MKFVVEATVLGMKRIKEGQMQDGRKYDSSTRIFVEDTLGEDKEDMRGTACAIYKIGPGSEFEKYKALAFPFRAELTMETEADGKGGTRMAVKAIKPVAVKKAA